jgi:hypothetical protein
MNLNSDLTLFNSADTAGLPSSCEPGTDSPAAALRSEGKNMNVGWIKIHRTIQDHWIWQDERKLKWWLDILLSANHEEKKVNIKMQLLTCGRGQTIRSLKGWADRWGVSKDSARAFMNLLEKDHMITHENLTKTTRITICNYEDYQSTEHDRTPKTKRKPNADQTLTGTNKNVKNDKEVLWRTDFNIYKQNCTEAFKRLSEDKKFIDDLTYLYVGCDIEKSMALSYFGYWCTEDGWNIKLKSKSKTIDWKATITKTLKFNLVKL